MQSLCIQLYYLSGHRRSDCAVMVWMEVLELEGVGLCFSQWKENVIGK